MTQAKGKFRNNLRKTAGASFAAITMLLAASPAFAGTSRGFENGGYFTRFNPVVAEFNQSGKPFRIVGLCQSACTLFLSIRNACVERTARFEFHAGSDGKGNILQSATQHMINSYNPKLRRFVIENGYMETLEFSAISADDMIEKFGYTECTPEHRLAEAQERDNERYSDRTADRDAPRYSSSDNRRGNEGSFVESPRYMPPMTTASRGNEGSFK